MPSNADDCPLFECRQCGDCCRGFGGTYVTDDDIRRIAAHVGSDPETVRRRYCQPSGGRLVLAQGAGGHCVFWDRLCTIHAVKPTMCRRWPFIPTLLIDPSNWRVMAGSCPGIRAGAPVSAIQRAVRHTLDHEKK